MMRHFIRTTGILITLTLLLVAAVGPVQACQIRPGQSDVAFVPTDDAEQVEDTALVCLALVGGTALLAGGVWMRTVRRMLS